MALVIRLSPEADVSILERYFVCGASGDCVTSKSFFFKINMKVYDTISSNFNFFNLHFVIFSFNC